MVLPSPLRDELLHRPARHHLDQQRLLVAVLAQEPPQPLPLLAPRLEGAAALARAARLLDEALHALRPRHADALVLAELAVVVARLLVQRRLLLRQLDVHPFGAVVRQEVAAQLLDLAPIDD